MKLTVVCTFVGVLALFVCDLNAQLGGPAFGWAIGQQASVSAVSLAIDGALAKSDSSTLPPESQVCETLSTEANDKKIDYFILVCDLSSVHRRSLNKFWQMPNWDWLLATIY